MRDEDPIPFKAPTFVYSYILFLDPICVLSSPLPSHLRTLLSDIAKTIKTIRSQMSTLHAHCLPHGVLFATHTAAPEMDATLSDCREGVLGTVSID